MTNLMNDPRVVRGNTYAAVPIKSGTEFRQPVLKPKELTGTRSDLPMKINTRMDFDMGFEPSTPRAVQGRDHQSMQTEAFVETLRDKPIEYQKQCQTDFYLDRPVQRLNVATKIGEDVATQIQQGDPELFDFDYEVEPILDALLSKILDTSRMEIFEEEELQAKKLQKQQFERTRNSALAETQKLESNQTRLHEEQERRHLQFKKTREQDAFTQKKLIGRVLSKQYLKHLQKNTYRILDQQGFFREPLEVDMYDSFVPWLYGQVQEQLEHTNSLNNAAETLLKGFQQQMSATHAQSIAKETQRRKDVQRQKDEEKANRKREKEAKKAEAERERREREEQALADGAQAADPAPAP